MFTEEEYNAFNEEGYLLLERMELQSEFSPAITDLLIENSDDLPGIIDVYIDSRVDYRGDNTNLDDIVHGNEFQFPGNCRRILQMSVGLNEIAQELVNMEVLTGNRISRNAVNDYIMVLPEPNEITNFEIIHDKVSESDFERIILSPEVIKNSLGRKVIGQKQPVRVISNALSSHIAKTAPLRPLVFFAIGPTGVGKTRTTEVIPEILGELEENLSVGHVRFDMNEFTENHRVSQILGSPPGYVGYSETSSISDLVESNDITVIVFDEIEKAHPDFLQVLMNAIDSGRLTAGSGIVVDLRKTIIMFTSNIGVNDGVVWTEENDEHSNQFEINQDCRGLLINHGIPREIVGRVQEFLLYGTLTAEHRAEILVQSMQEFMAEFELNVQFVDPDLVVNFLESRGGSSSFGGRQYRAAIGEYLQPSINQFLTNSPAYRGPVSIDKSGIISIVEPEEKENSTEEEDDSLKSDD